MTEQLERARLVTICGPGGSGKTRLAVEMARGAAPSRLVRFADLAPVDSGAQVLPVVAESVGVPDVLGLSGDEGFSAMVTALAAQPRLLLIVDNCEHVVDEIAALVHRLLQAVTDLQVLVTSQVPLRVDGEALFDLAPLPLPDELAGPEEISASEAVRLFATRASDHDPDFSLTPDVAAVVARICRQLDGMPLAIELAAAQTRAYGVDEVAARLDDALGFLISGQRSAAARHRTLRAAVDWSIGLLDGTERDLLERLAIFSDGFTLKAAEQVCAGGGIDREDVAAVLAQLVDRSLVIRRSRGRSVRYWLLETIRQYGRQQLSESEGLRAPSEPTTRRRKQDPGRA